MSSLDRPLVLSAAHLADEEGDAPGWLRVEGERIVGRGDGAAPAEAARDAIIVRCDLVTPGLVDIHVHGACGVDFAQRGVDPQPAIDHHRAQGATTLVASLATAPLDETAERLRELQPFIASGALAGIHLEGPWLSPRRRGAHREELLLEPRPVEVDALVAAGAGAVRMVTIAPELPGALETIRALRAQDVVVALGHTDADAATIERAVDAGASVMTHLFNGMRPLHHREPGPVGVALARPDIAVELIADGIHVDDTVVDMTVRAAGDSLLLVSDAMAATGLGDGAYELAGSHVVVSGGVAQLADGSSLAGSTATLGSIVSRAWARGLAPGTLAEAASARPARVLGLPIPSLRAGATADLVAFAADGTRRTMRAGRWLAS